MTIALQRPLVRDTIVVAAGLLASLLFPLLVHLLPAERGPPAGARLLPIFYAALVVALRAGIVPALAVAIIAPLSNRLLTGMPAGPMLPTLLLELTLFTVLVLAARQVLPRIVRFVGPLAYLIAAVIVKGLMVPGFTPLATLASSLSTAWPGLVMLLAVGGIAGLRVVREDGGRPATP